MAKKTKSTKETKVKVQEASEIEETIVEKPKQEAIVETKSEEPVKVEKRTLCYLASKANHIIEIENNGQISYIQPFGKIKVIKEQIKVNPNDARYLAFIKA